MDDGGEGDGPSFDLTVEHPYVGDLAVTAGVVDGEGNGICSVEVLQPQPGEAGDGGLSGGVDMAACGEEYPPSPEFQWYVQVVDTAAVDEGAVTELTLNGPDGEIEFDGLPADIPDNDPDGVLLVTDGETAGPTTSSSSGGAPVLDVVIDHPYSGDLSVEVGAVAGNGDVVCQVQVATPDANNSAPGFELSVPVDDCAGAFPPAQNVEFYLFVVDTLAADEGQLVEATLTGPDGDVYAVQDTGGIIPDADPEGVTYFFAPAG
jgi:hypothetical protein